jgi:hypothetical protein
MRLVSKAGEETWFCFGGILVAGPESAAFYTDEGLKVSEP